MKFISKDLAFILKEKGFDKPCFGRYTFVNDKLNLHKSKSQGETHKDLLYNYISPGNIFTPTTDQVLEWLREEKNIFIWMKPYHTYATKNNICWDWNISIINNSHELSKYCSDEGFAEYEDACIAGIEYVINNLI